MSAEITKYNDVKSLSTEEYFEGNQFSIDAFNKKYSAFDKESYVQALKRVCDYIASVEETKELQEYWSQRWFDEIFNDWWHPAGSIMQGAGSGRKISLCNCTTISLGGLRTNEEWDNLESIIKNSAYTVAKCAAYRQGLGIDFSRLRPIGTKVLNSANESTGSIHWMKFIDSIGYYVGQKGRIPAMLFSISCTHPDVIEFIQVKSDYTKIQNANISVQCTDAFYKAVENDEEWEMFFDIPEVKIGDKVYLDVHSADKDALVDKTGFYKVAVHARPPEKIVRKEKARKILKLIAKNMFANAEPGIQNIDTARKYSNSDYVFDPKDEYDSRILSTNACSEQYLSRESLCVLASINCERFSKEKDGYEIELGTIGPSINRFLDNVNECELRYGTYATPHQKTAITKLRRTGAGYTNVAGWLFKKNLEYGSEEGNVAVADFTERYNYYLYKSSILLGKEKGSFGLFNREKFENSPFVKRMMDLGLKFTAMRNCTCSSIAPTGTLSLMFRGLILSYGIEPSFGLYFWKRTRMAGKYVYYFNVPRIVRDFFKDAGFPIPIDFDTVEDTWDGKYGRPVAEFIEAHKKQAGIKFKPATEILPTDKLELMSKVMKHIDSSISVTYMLPESTNWKDIYDFILEAHKKEVKSIAAFPDRKMYGIVSLISFKELALKLKKEGIEIHPQNFSASELAELELSKEQVVIKTDHVPKRPKALNADIHVITAKGEKFVVVIGLLNNVPYEVFGGHANGFDLINNSKGKITKISSGKYCLESEEVNIEDFSQQFTPVEQILFRMVSMSLRHGIPIEFLVDQMDKASEDMLSLASATKRVLKKYIKDGQPVKGKKCPNCASTELVYIDGCVSCSNCNWSQCS